jgi:hypothetical protein
MAFVKECKQSSKQVLDVNFDHILNQRAFDTSKDLQDVFSDYFDQSCTIDDSDDINERDSASMVVEEYIFGTNETH